MAAPVQEKRFLIQVERQWKLWLLPFLAFAYFGWVMFLAIGDYVVPGVTMNHWVLGGLGLFGFVLVAELLLLPRRKVKAAKPSRKERRAAKKAAKAAAKAEAKAAGATAAAETVEAQPESSFARPQAEEHTIQPPPAPEPEPQPEPEPAPKAAARGPSAEVRIPGEEVRGRRVLEVSLPSKSEHEGSLYAKAYVPVGTDLVVRVETLVAEPADFN